jgi:hypothetical protein
MRRKGSVGVESKVLFYSAEPIATSPHRKISPSPIPTSYSHNHPSFFHLLLTANAAQMSPILNFYVGPTLLLGQLQFFYLRLFLRHPSAHHNLSSPVLPPSLALWSAVRQPHVISPPPQSRCFTYGNWFAPRSTAFFLFPIFGHC